MEITDSTELASIIMERIERDVEREQAEIARLEAQLPVLRRDADKANSAFFEYPDPPDGSITAEFRELDKAAELASKKTFACMDAIKARRNRIEHLRSGEELDRRMEMEIRLKGVRMTDEQRPKKETARDQGVPDAYLNEEGNFRIGMDARLKSDLVNSALGLITKAEPGASLQVFSEKQATDLLGKRGWMPFLDRKREIESAKAEKKAASAKAREERERERAAEKEKKAAEKAAAAEAKKAEGASSSSSKSGDKAAQDRAQREAKASA